MNDNMKEVISRVRSEDLYLGAMIKVLGQWLIVLEKVYLTDGRLILVLDAPMNNRPISLVVELDTQWDVKTVEFIS
jgi:hypothetical protein